MKREAKQKLIIAYHEGHTAGLKTAATLLLTHAKECESNLGGEGVKGVGRTVFGISASVALRPE